MAVLRIATDKKPQERQSAPGSDADWHVVAVFGPDAEYAFEHLKTGALVFIEGFVRTRSWKNRAGQTRSSTEVIAQTLQRLQAAGAVGRGS